jgi:hypothetical protein
VEGGGDQEEEPVLLGTPPLIHEEEPVLLGTPPLIHEEDLDTDQYSNAPLWVHHIDNILGPTSSRGLARRVLDQELHAMSIEELSLFTEAEQDPCWRCEELKSIEDNHTWVLADLPLRR